MSIFSPDFKNLIRINKKSTYTLTNFFSRWFQYSKQELLQFSISILYSLKTPDHWYMRYTIIIYELHWCTGDGHRKAKYNKCKKRKNKYKIHGNVVEKSQDEHCLGFSL